MTDVLSVSVDNAQTRLLHNRTARLIDGRERTALWDELLSSGAMIDSITRTGMLTPLPLTPDWQNTATHLPAGNYNRFSLLDYQFVNALNWVEHNRRFDGDIYLHSLGDNEGVSTSVRFPRNQALFVSWHNYNVGNETFEQLQCGWSDGAGGGSTPDNPPPFAVVPDIRLRFLTDGKTQIYKNGVLVGEGNIFERRVSTQTAYGTQTSSTKASRKQMAGQTVEVFLIPCRRRELLIFTNQGGGFSFCFEDMDPNDPDPIITADDAPWFWYVPSGQATVQCAPMPFLLSGYLLSRPFSLERPPQPGEVPAITVYWDAPGYGSVSVEGHLVEVDNSDDFAPDGVKRQARLRVDMAGDGTSTPFVYGASVEYAPITASTPNTPTVIDQWVKKAVLSVPDDPNGTLLTLTCKSPDEIEDAGAVNVKTGANRPLEAKIGSVAILTGRTKAPRWTEAWSDAARDLVIEARDFSKAQEEYLIREPLPVDGLTLSNGLRYFAKMPSFSDADMDIEAVDFPLPTVAGASQGEFALLPKVGDKPSRWLQRLRDTYAKNSVYGWVPTATGPKWRFRLISTLNAAASGITLYNTREDAKAAYIANGYSEDDAEAFAFRAVYRSFHEVNIECEANDIWVMGLNPRTGKPLLKHLPNYPSQDPALAVAARPDNWVGDLRQYAWVDSSIVTDEAANWCAGMLGQRLFPSRRTAEWECEFLRKPDGSPFWKGDLVTLAGEGVYRIIDFNGEAEVEYEADEDDPDDADVIWRPFIYHGERVRNEG